MSNEIKEIEVEIEHAKKAVKLKTAIDRLFKNRDFKLVFQEGYFKEEAANLVQRKAMPGMDTPEMQLAIENALVGIGQVQQYLFLTRMKGAQMEAALNEKVETHEQLLAEED